MNRFPLSVDEDLEKRRPGLRPTTAMLGNDILNKEQLYDLAQQILGIKKFEHQLLYNAMQARHYVLHGHDETTGLFIMKLNRPGKLRKLVLKLKCINCSWNPLTSKPPPSEENSTQDRKSYKRCKG